MKSHILTAIATVACCALIVYGVWSVHGINAALEESEKAKEAAIEELQAKTKEAEAIRATANERESKAVERAEAETRKRAALQSQLRAKETEIATLRSQREEIANRFAAERADSANLSGAPLSAAVETKLQKRDPVAVFKFEITGLHVANEAGAKAILGGLIEGDEAKQLLANVREELDGAHQSLALTQEQAASLERELATANEARFGWQASAESEKARADQWANVSQIQEQQVKLLKKKAAWTNVRSLGVNGALFGLGYALGKAGN